LLCCSAGGARGGSRKRSPGALPDGPDPNNNNGGFDGSDKKGELTLNLPMQVIMNDPRYDKTFKILFGEQGKENRLISFLNSVFDLKGKDQIQNIRYLPTSLPSGGVRDILFDLRIEGVCETYNGHRFVVEMQQASTPGHMNRWIYYGARELATQVMQLPREVPLEGEEDEDQDEEPEPQVDDKAQEPQVDDKAQELQFDDTAQKLESLDEAKETENTHRKRI
jgi:hypothetical protein